MDSTSLVTSHFLALSYRRLIAANRHLEAEKAELAKEVARLKEAELNKYHIDNPIFQDEVFPHVDKGIDTALDRLRERSGLAPGFEAFQFPNVYLALKKKLVDINRKAKGKDKVDSSGSEEEDESEDEESEDQATRLGDAGEENQSQEGEDSGSSETGC